MTAIFFTGLNRKSVNPMYWHGNGLTLLYTFS